MAHQTTVTGRASELMAAMALMNVGWEVAEPVVDEVYDLVGRDPVNGAWATIQCKTLRLREKDGQNWYIIEGKRSNGGVYSSDEVDYMCGVDAETGDVYMTETRGLTEYWQRPGEHPAKYRWVKLTAEKEFGEVAAH
ncbi:group I intron-associated PD-(D/E)XK endonuclease [Salibacterium aidingense]|uniref:group I intron-associated PD-(D/E)XK endonuclease n=1 Tax=Salibacterium aidingense TaxID=384933 RepID=UPI003BE506A1